MDGQAGLVFCGAWSDEHAALLASREPPPPPLGAPVFDRRVFIAAATQVPPAEEIPESTRANTIAVHAQVTRLVSAATTRKVAHRAAKMACDVLLRSTACFSVRITAAQVARARAAGGAAART